MNARGLLTIALGIATTTACLPDPVCETLGQPISGTGITGQGIAGLMAFAEDDCGLLNPCNCTLTDGFAFVLQVDVMPADSAAARAAIVRSPMERVASEGGRWVLETPAGPHLVCGDGADTCVGVVVAEGEVSTVHFVQPTSAPTVVEGGAVIQPPTFQVGELVECLRDEDCDTEGVCYDTFCRRDPGCSDDDVETPCESTCRGRCIDPALAGYCTSDDECPDEQSCRTSFQDGLCVVDRRPDSDGACVGYCTGGCFLAQPSRQDPATGTCFEFGDSCTPPGFPPCE
jgi:hypothetical protein